MSETSAQQKMAPYKNNLLYEADPVFTTLYREGLQRTGTPEAGERRHQRFFNLMQFFCTTLPMRGSIAECGCWKGLSSYMMCHYARRHDAAFSGEGFHIFDSFQGLSEPRDEDRIVDPAVHAGRKTFGGAPGDFCGGREEVRQALAGFPGVQLHEGWIPQSLGQAPEMRYKFVHIDLDLYEPIRGAIEYFWPRMLPGGVVIFDDYGCLSWPGAKKAVDDFCGRHGVPLLALSTGQGVIWKR